MSLVINNVELDVDMEDLDFLERYKKSFADLQENEKSLPRTGDITVIVKSYCDMYYKLFDSLFGDGTADKIFKDKRNIRLCEEAYIQLIAACSEQVKSLNNRRNVFMNKYNPGASQNRQQKRYYNNHKGGNRNA